MVCFDSAAIVVGLLLMPYGCRADGAISLYNSFPYELLKRQSGVTLTPSFLDRLRLSTVYMGNLSTGTFVSPRGLIVANHYNLRSCIGSITRTGEDLLTHGFYAANEQDERQCPNAEAAVLTSIEDVTRTIEKRLLMRPKTQGARRWRKQNGCVRLQSFAARLSRCMRVHCTTYTGIVSTRMCAWCSHLNLWLLIIPATMFQATSRIGI
jgi:hypothetical protein